MTAPADCRGCAHCHDVREGESIRCGAEECAVIRWDLALAPAERCTPFVPRSAPPAATTTRPPDLEVDRALISADVATLDTELRRARSSEDAAHRQIAGMRTALEDVVDLMARGRLATTGDVEGHRALFARLKSLLSRSPVEDPLRAPGRSLFHAVTALDNMVETDAELTDEQRVEVYRQAYLAQEAWLDLDPEAQTAGCAAPVEDPRDAEIAKLRNSLAVCADGSLMWEADIIREYAAARLAGVDDPRKARPVRISEESMRALLKRCATDLSAAVMNHWGHTGVGLRDHEQDCIECRPLYAALAALRSSGVEPDAPGKETTR